MKKILFLIHDLGQGGAEKVLVNLVNNMDRSKFDISVTVLFGGGVNEQFLAPDIHFHAVFPKEVPGNSKLMKLMTPKQLHRLCVKEHYDIEVSYLEGPSARVISGCQDSDTKLVSWIHVEQHTMDKLAGSFRSEEEARVCYNRFDQTVCVSQYVHNDFCQLLNFRKPCRVLYNTVESDKILAEASAPAPELADDGKIRLIAVGTLKQSKGYMRLLQILRRLRDLYLGDLKAGQLGSGLDLNHGVPREKEPASFQRALKTGLKRLQAGAVYDLNPAVLQKQIRKDQKGPHPLVRFMKRCLRYLKRKLR